MTDSPVLPRRTLLLIALVQGIALYFLYSAAENSTWPSQSPLWNFPLWTLAVVVPVFLQLSLRVGNQKRVISLVAAFSLILVGVALYTGYQALPVKEFPISNLVLVYTLSVGLACFKALMYLQQRADQAELSYRVLFTNSWRNCFTLALSSLLVLAFYLVLLLWAGLFRAIEIDFFHRLFREDWFLIPVLTVAHGVGIIIFRNLTGVIDSITRIARGLCSLLLPVVALLSVVFLASLPVVGLDVLWNTGRGTFLLLWLLAAILFLTNAVYQDGRDKRPYPLAIHRLLYIALLTTPVLSVLSFYGLYLRLDAHGWSVARAWGFVAWLILSVFAIGYVVGVLRRRDNWTFELARVNTGMGLGMLALLLIANSPLLDFRKLSLSSQLNRVEAGDLTIGQLDFWYLERSLARPGYLYVQAKIAEIGDSDPGLLAKLEDPVNLRWARPLPEPSEKWQRMTYLPEPYDVPAPLRELIDTEARNFGAEDDPVLLKIDLDGDTVDEYVYLQSFYTWGEENRLYYRDGDKWLSLPVTIRAQGMQGVNIREAIVAGKIDRLPNRFDRIQIDGIHIQTVGPE